MNFKNKCNNKDNLCIYRITNDRDIVTATLAINFKHVGTNIRITENKIDLYKNNSYPWWYYSLWYCWRISDHNVDLYYERLVNINGINSVIINSFLKTYFYLLFLIFHI